MHVLFLYLISYLHAFTLCSFVTDDCKFTEQHHNLAKLPAVLTTRDKVNISEMGDKEYLNALHNTSNTNGKEKTS